MGPPSAWFCYLISCLQIYCPLFRSWYASNIYRSLSPILLEHILKICLYNHQTFDRPLALQLQNFIILVRSCLNKCLFVLGEYELLICNACEYELLNRMLNQLLDKHHLYMQRTSTNAIYVYISSSFNYTMFHFGIFPSVYILANYATWRFELLDLHVLYPLKC